MSLLRVNDSRSTLTLQTGACSICQKPFIKRSTLHTICSVRCLNTVEVVESKRQKAEKRETKKKLDALKPRSHWLKECQRDFNAYIRARDAALVCISCGRDHGGQWHAGHYLSTGAKPELRFDERNVHKQCQPCNTHLHGNLVLYRLALLARLGAEVVAWLEGPHDAKKFTVEELKAMAADYRRKAKEMAK